MFGWWYVAVPVLLWAAIIGGIVLLVYYPGAMVRLLCGGGMLVCVCGFWVRGPEDRFERVLLSLASVGAVYIGLSILFGGL